MATGSLLSNDNEYNGSNDSYGDSPEVTESSLKATNRVVSSIDQAVAMTETDIQDAKKLINNAKKIAAKKNGAPPYNPRKLKDQGKSFKANFSTRFLQKELNRAAPRLYMPILQASTLTAAELPAGWPKGQEKTEFFRQTITRAIRGWRKNDSFWRGLMQEVTDFGFAFAAWTDKYEWRPHLCRMDRGFVPRGTEIMDDKLARFTLKWDYQPWELLQLAKKSVDGGSDKWNKDAVAAAVDAASLPALPNDLSQLRKWEDLIREQSWDYNYTKGQKVIECRHLYVLEFDGKVSHYILWPGGRGNYKLLYEDLDCEDGTDSVVIPLTFGYGDGTIHGSWGAGQLLYDLASRVEKARCDSFDNLAMSNKTKIQVPNAKDAAGVQLLVNDTNIIVAGGQFAPSGAVASANPQGYIEMDNAATRWAQEIVGSYLPPAPRQASKAATQLADQAISAEEAVQQDVLENSLKQVALVIANMTRRMLDPDSDDEYAQAIRKKLLGDNVGWIKSIWNKARRSIKFLQKITPPPPIALSEEELDILINQPVIQSVSDFTPYAAQQRGAFAASVQNNPLFRQNAVARFMAAGVPSAGQSFVDEIVAPEGDTSTQAAQQRQQEMESATMTVIAKALPVIPTDDHFIHWSVIEPQIEQGIKMGAIPQATAALSHAAAHFAAGQANKSWPPDQINAAKARLGQLQRALEAKTQEQQELQQAQQNLAAQQQKAAQIAALRQQAGGGNVVPMPPQPPPQAAPPQAI